MPVTGEFPFLKTGVVKPRRSFGENGGASLYPGQVAKKVTGRYHVLATPATQKGNQ